MSTPWLTPTLIHIGLLYLFQIHFICTIRTTMHPCSSSDHKNILAQRACLLHKTCKEDQLPHLLSISTWCKSTPWLTYHFGTPWFAYSECLTVHIPSSSVHSKHFKLDALIPYTKTCVYSFPCSCSLWLTVHTIEHVCQQTQPALDHPRRITNQSISPLGSRHT